MRIMDKAILFIGGSYLQLRTIKLAKELGLYIVVTDREQTSLGKEFADRFEIIDGENILGLLELSQEISENYTLVGAYSSSDFGLQAVAAISEKFGLPGCKVASVSKALDKAQATVTWAKEGLPTPQGIVLDNSSSSLSLIEEHLVLPVILKPLDSCGSQGISSAATVEELPNAYAYARKFSTSVLVEPLLTGRHIDVNGLFLDGKFIACGVMERFFSDYPYHYSTWGCQAPLFTQEQEFQFYDLVEKSARALDISSGPVKADLILTDRGPVILELAPRFHGDVITSYTTPLLTQIDPVKIWLTYLLNGAGFSETSLRFDAEVAGWMVLYSKKNGTLLDVRGTEQAKQEEGIKHVYLSKNIGDRVKLPQDNTAICGFIWGKASSKESLYEQLNQASAHIEFLVE